jgi:pimeloyl-ACP methyl ester carboxylesterase
MTAVTIKSVQCISAAGLHRMAYKQWGDPDNQKVLVCVHGVTRVGDDFDALASALSDHYRVVCPDVVGRGRSGKLRNPLLYQIPQYVSDMVTLVARVTANSDDGAVDWFGTSMGGLIGMALASLPDNPIRKLVLNDIGPTLDPAALRRIGDYIGQDLRFKSLLSHETAQQMLVRGPKPQLVEIADTGHAPTFINADQIAIARKFLVG